MQVLFGELLGKIVQLTDHDVAEILEHQAATRRRFGAIALEWGLCKPQDVWRTWAMQCEAMQTTIDLSQQAIDPTALALLPHEAARRLGVIPLRTFAQEVVLAAARCDEQTAGEVGRIIGKRCRLLPADERQIIEALSSHYQS
jgi:hypothetical protein